MNKILISVSYYTPHVSGLTNSIKNLAHLLSQHDYQITILTTQHDKILSRVSEQKNVLIQRIPYLFKFHKGFFMPTFLIETFFLLRKNDQVIIVLPQFEGFVVALVAKILRKKIITLYVCEVTMSGNFVTKVLEFLLRLLHRVTLAISEHIVTLTVDFARHNILLKKYGNRILAIPPVIINPQSSLETEILFKKKLRKKKKVIGFIGRVSSEKGIEYLLHTIPMLVKEWQEDFLIVLAGALGVGESEYIEETVALINKYKKSILWLQKLDDDELGAFYKSLDVLVLPSINTTEAFGMVQVEAMFSGIPVVASNLPGVRVPIKETGMGELVPIKNSHDLAQAIIRVITKKKEYVKNMQEVAIHFDPKEIFRQWQKILS